MDIAAELLRWLQDLEPEFAFLLALPFGIGALGLLSLGRRSRAQRENEDAGSPGAARPGGRAGAFRKRAHS